MTSLEVKIMEALDQGALLDLAELGGETALYEQIEPATSPFYADIAVLLLETWSALVNPKAAEAFIVSGLKANRDRAGHARVLTTIADQPATDLRPFVVALEARARDAGVHEILRVDAAAWLLRLALVDPRWKHTALATLIVLEEVDDPHAEPMLSRLAAAAFETFRDREALGILDRQIDRSPDAAQAHTERAIIALAEALDQDTLEEIETSLQDAEHRLKAAVLADATRRDSKVYLILAQALAPIAQGRAPSASLTEALREEALVRALWDAPSPAYDWLVPSPSADLDWIPVVDDLHALATDLAQPSWFDAARTMDNVLRAYRHDRSVRVDFGGTAKLVQPAIEAAFVRERGLLAHLDQWLNFQAGNSIDLGQATQLRANIQARLAGAPPGKPRRAARGRAPFSTTFRPI